MPAGTSVCSFTQLCFVRLEVRVPMLVASLKGLALARFEELVLSEAVE